MDLKEATKIIQHLETVPLPLLKENRKVLINLLRSLPDKNPEADALCMRGLNLINKDDAARLKKLVAQHDALIEKIKRHEHLTAEEEKLLQTVDGLLSEH